MFCYKMRGWPAIECCSEYNFSDINTEWSSGLCALFQLSFSLFSSVISFFFLLHKIIQFYILKNIFMLQLDRSFIKRSPWGFFTVSSCLPLTQFTWWGQVSYCICHSLCALLVSCCYLLFIRKVHMGSVFCALFESLHCSNFSLACNLPFVFLGKFVKYLTNLFDVSIYFWVDDSEITRFYSGMI